jgi:asparagine synthase (glutamine-hydrolysing)
MSGIAGEICVECAGEAAWHERRRQLERMLRPMETRGPDAVAHFQDRQATIGVRRLAMVDVLRGTQPWSTADGRYTIAYNGTCFELNELRHTLQQQGICFRTHSDAEVVLEVYAKWGVPGLERLNGMFAFAIWDAWQGDLFLARDRLGIKPLYYMQDDQRILFASTVQALSARDDLTCEIDGNALELLLSSQGIPAPYSIYRSIRKLPAGFWARWRAGRFQVQRWWDLPVEAETDHAITERAALELLDTLLERTTRHQIAEERPTGLCLSGGVDSGLLASGLRGEPVPTFSLGNAVPSQADGRWDESPLACRVARRFGLHSYVVRLPADPLSLWQEVVAALDEPLIDTTCLSLHALGRGLVPHVTVALSGTGGDELFGGYARYLAARWAAWSQLLPSWQRLDQRCGWTASGSPAARLLEALRLGPLGCHLRLLNPTSAPLTGDLRQPEFAQGVDVSFAELAAECFARPRQRGQLTKLSYVDIKLLLADGVLGREDRMLMAHSLEGRFPFLDHRLVEFAFRLPDRLKLRNLETKRLLRRLALRRGVPTTVVQRRQQRFEIPLSNWLRGPLAEPLKDHLLPRQAWVKTFLQPHTINRLVQEHSTATHDHGRLLWSLLLLESWHQYQTHHFSVLAPRAAATSAFERGASSGRDRLLPTQERSLFADPVKALHTHRTELIQVEDVTAAAPEGQSFKPAAQAAGLRVAHAAAPVPYSHPHAWPTTVSDVPTSAES